MSESPSEEKQEVLNDSDTEVEIETEEQVKQVVAEVVKQELFSGPIPHPDIMRGYEDILPGSANRILVMAENQSMHRQSMERKMIEAESRDGLLGILFAFCLGAGCIIAAVIMVVMVPQNSGAISGAILGTAGIGSIIATFIKSTRSSHNSHDDNIRENRNDDKKSSEKSSRK